MDFFFRFLFRALRARLWRFWLPRGFFPFSPFLWMLWLLFCWSSYFWSKKCSQTWNTFYDVTMWACIDDGALWWLTSLFSTSTSSTLAQNALNSSFYFTIFGHLSYCALLMLGALFLVRDLVCTALVSLGVQFPYASDRQIWAVTICFVFCLVFVSTTRWFCSVCVSSFRGTLHAALIISFCNLVVSHAETGGL